MAAKESPISAPDPGHTEAELNGIRRCVEAVSPIVQRVSAASTQCGESTAHTTDEGDHQLSSGHPTPRDVKRAASAHNVKFRSTLAGFMLMDNLRNGADTCADPHGKKVPIPSSPGAAKGRDHSNGRPGGAAASPHADRPRSFPSSGGSDRFASPQLGDSGCEGGRFLTADSADELPRECSLPESARSEGPTCKVKRIEKFSPKGAAGDEATELRAALERLRAKYAKQASQKRQLKKDADFIRDENCRLSRNMAVMNERLQEASSKTPKLLQQVKELRQRERNMLRRLQTAENGDRFESRGVNTSPLNTACHLCGCNELLPPPSPLVRSRRAAASRDSSAASQASTSAAANRAKWTQAVNAHLDGEDLSGRHCRRRVSHTDQQPPALQRSATASANRRTVATAVNLEFAGTGGGGGDASAAALSGPSGGSPSALNVGPQPLWGGAAADGALPSPPAAEGEVPEIGTVSRDGPDSWQRLHEALRVMTLERDNAAAHAHKYKEALKRLKASLEPLC